MAPFSSETSEVPSRYLSVCNKRLAVRYRFLPAMLIEFPNDDPRDSKYARTPKLPIMRIISEIKLLCQQIHNQLHRIRTAPGLY